MKKLLTLFALLFLGTSLLGQTLAERYAKLVPMYKTDRVMVNVHYDMWQEVPDYIESSLNRGVALQFINDMPLGRSDFSIGIGLRLDINNFYSNAITSGVIDSNTFRNEPSRFILLDSLNTLQDFSYSTNRLVANYLTIPVELRFRPGRYNRLKFAIGADFGYKVRSHIKYRGDDIFLNNGNEIELKIYDIRHLNLFRYGVYTRIGFGQLSVEGYYALSTLFKKDKGPEMYPIQIGLNLTIF